jgi:twinkle protein
MDAQTTKALLNDRAEDFARWLFPAGRKNGNEWLVGSLDGEAGRSLSICIGGERVGVFKDFATGDKADNLVELLAQARRVPFKEALHACAEWLGPSVTATSPINSAARRQSPRRACRFPGDIYQPTDQECRDVMRMVETLVSDSSLCERIARARGWKPETVRQLGLESYLGWYDGKLAFIYDTGVKLRWREKGERIIRWAFGKPWLWRGAWISQAETVYLTEGESDAISLIDGGIESDRGTVAIATPSATTFDETWVALFKGKHVVLAFDDDEAGAAGTLRVSKLLRSNVRSLGKLNWEGLRYASGGS